MVKLERIRTIEEREARVDGGGGYEGKGGGKKCGETESK